METSLKGFTGFLFAPSWQPAAGRQHPQSIHKSKFSTAPHHTTNGRNPAQIAVYTLPTPIHSVLKFLKVCSKILPKIFFSIFRAPLFLPQRRCAPASTVSLHCTQTNCDTCHASTSKWRNVDDWLHWNSKSLVPTRPSPRPRPPPPRPPPPRPPRPKRVVNTPEQSRKAKQWTICCAAVGCPLPPNN